MHVQAGQLWELSLPEPCGRIGSQLFRHKSENAERRLS
jgi:hypothetical protein